IVDSPLPAGPPPVGFSFSVRQSYEGARSPFTSTSTHGAAQADAMGAALPAAMAAIATSQFCMPMSMPPFVSFVSFLSFVWALCLARV
ncbi:hypothetical protein, partial [Mycobacterium sp. 2YAF39]|uniref:hypothetical protein n=1 Tax=Mycobacterium sp. 2YAF39 TaxID=3233033 RepID=UPI003F9443A9